MELHEEEGTEGQASVVRTNSHAPSKGFDGTLGTRVDGVLGDTFCLACNGTHEDDPAIDRHALVRLLCNEELAAGVDLHDAVVLCFLHVLEMAERHDARVGAADVELTEVAHDLVHEMDRLLDIGHVGLDGHGVGTCLHRFDLLDHFLGGF